MTLLTELTCKDEYECLWHISQCFGVQPTRCIDLPIGTFLNLYCIQSSKTSDTSRRRNQIRIWEYLFKKSRYNMHFFFKSPNAIHLFCHENVIWLPKEFFFVWTCIKWSFPAKVAVISNWRAIKFPVHLSLSLSSSPFFLLVQPSVLRTWSSILPIKVICALSLQNYGTAKKESPSNWADAVAAVWAATCHHPTRWCPKINNYYFCIPFL